MKRTIVLALGLLLVPSVVAAQVEIGMDAGLSIESVDDDPDDLTSFSLPVSEVRVGFAAGEMMIVETRVALGYLSVDDFSATDFGLVPGVNVLLGDRFYVRGEAGLMYSSLDTGTADESATQYLLGAGAGLRVPVVESVLFRAEAGVDRWLENEDEFIPASWEFRLVAGVSAVIN